MIDSWAAAPASVLALVTTIHVAMLVLRKYRSAPASAIHLSILPSIAFAASPWLFPALPQIAVGLAAHTAWFVACEKLLPVPVAAVAAPSAARSPARSAASAPKPAPAAKPPAAASTKPSAPPAKAAPSTGPRDFVPVPVLAVLDETENIRTYRMARPGGFHFEAGRSCRSSSSADRCR
jgi:hypothetical protein